MITRQTAAGKIAAYLHGEISLAQLVDWAESAIQDGEFDERDIDVLRSVVARLGVADVCAFGLEWNDCQQMLLTSSSQTTPAGTRTATVPKHREVAAGTLRSILRQAGLSAEEFGSL